MRISDWSSDVCSSDLSTALAGITAPGAISRYLVSRRLNPKVAVTASTGLAVASTSTPRMRALPPFTCTGSMLLAPPGKVRSEEHTSELQSLMRISYAVFCLQNTKHNYRIDIHTDTQSKTKSLTHRHITSS